MPDLHSVCVRLDCENLVKVYITIFICFMVITVYLQVVTELSTEVFLATFDRFLLRYDLKYIFGL